MKKIIITIVCAISMISAGATIIFRACNQEVYTVDPSYFEDEEEAEDFYMDLADYLCGN
ncbi:MAG: hypothetical protein HDS06_02935 [Bacteroides sp.]|nr:hypothetical protein [Bacteroides sp.]